jgi:hypothetical protein
LYETSSRIVIPAKAGIQYKIVSGGISRIGSQARKVRADPTGALIVMVNIILYPGGIKGNLKSRG